MIRQKTFYSILFFILLIGLLLRLYPAIGNNFYFTMDQGNDAVHIREILARHQILLNGPETGIEGVYHGPLWYYFIAIGYVLFAGHPFGAVFMLIILNLLLTALIMLKVAQKVSPTWGLLVGASLQIFWWFYDTSRYGFNPFPLVFLSVILIFQLINFLEGNNKNFILAAIPIGLAFNTEMAAAAAFLFLYLTVGLWGIFKKRLPIKTIVLGVALLSLFFVPKTLSEVKTSSSQSHALQREFRDPQGIFSQTRFKPISIKFKEIITKRITPQSNEVGIAVLSLVLFLFLRTRKKNQFTKRFVYLSLILVIISWIWFGSNKGWQVWHTIYVRPLLFIAILLMLFDIPRKIGLLLLAIILISQIFFFKQRYWYFLKPSIDPSLLVNELAAIDWVYQKSQGLGFYVYTYLPSVYDYPYQYLFWWHGQKKYGYLPCEYSTIPNVPDFFVPNVNYYQQPKRSCSNLRFLIAEPAITPSLRDDWLRQVRDGTQLLDEAKIGSIELEKRAIN